MNSAENVMGGVCQALKDLSEECFGYLLECFPIEDLMDMKKLHFEEVINFLLKFADGKITKNKVSECGAVKEIMDDISIMEAMDEENESFQTVPKLFEREATNNAMSMFCQPFLWLAAFVVFVICNDTDLPEYFLRL